MLRSLSTGATGMIAQQTNLDVIANNIANVNTNGFKKVRAEFQDLIYQKQRTAGAQVGQGTFIPVGLEVGLGVKTAATTRIFDSGIMTSTGRDLDIAIEGDGFLAITLDDGTIAYTRDGALKMDKSISQIQIMQELCKKFKSLIFKTNLSLDKSETADIEKS